MESTAHLRFATIAPRKVSVVAALVRGMPAGQAVSTLQWTKRAAATPVRKLIESAIANATDKSKGSVDIDKLIVKSIHVDQGPTSRRYMPRAMGRATRINKKTTHLHVVLSDETGKKAKK